MKNNRKGSLFFIALISSFACVLVLDASPAFAVEATPHWRKVWNNIMLFFNFGILVFVFVKYARKPLMNFLKNMCGKIEETLNTANHQLREAQAKVDAEKAKLDAIGSHLEEIEKRILHIAKSEKDFIIEHGKATAEGMIEHAKAYAKYKFASAQKILSDELAEIAVAMAQEKLARSVSAQDDERFLNAFLKDLKTSEKHYRMGLT